MEWVVSSGKTNTCCHFLLLYSWFTDWHRQTSTVQQRLACSFLHCLWISRLLNPCNEIPKDCIASLRLQLERGIYTSDADCCIGLRLHLEERNSRTQIAILRGGRGGGGAELAARSTLTTIGPFSLLSIGRPPSPKISILLYPPSAAFWTGVINNSQDTIFSSHWSQMRIHFLPARI